MTLPLSNKTALVTGVSRRKGIGFAVARRLAALGASVFIHHYSPHDAEQPWGVDDLDRVRTELRESLVAGAVLGDTSADLRLADAPADVIRTATALTGNLDILVCNHARSGGDGSILELTADRLDDHWSANTRSTLLLTQAFAKPFAQRAAHHLPVDEHRTGRVIWMTSGQQDGPMRGEVAYAASKAALAGVTATVAAELLEIGVILNTVNPGPVNTGYLDLETTDRPLEQLLAQAASTPFGRFGLPSDPARLIGWLVGDDGRWIVGQVVKTDGGFSLT